MPIRKPERVAPCVAGFCGDRSVHPPDKRRPDERLAGRRKTRPRPRKPTRQPRHPLRPRPPKPPTKLSQPPNRRLRKRPRQNHSAPSATTARCARSCNARAAAATSRPKKRAGFSSPPMKDSNPAARTGPALLPRKPEESPVVQYISGPKPEMPKKGETFKPVQIELISQWIAQAGKDDTPASVQDPVTAENPPKYSSPPVIPALAYSPETPCWPSLAFTIPCFIRPMARGSSPGSSAAPSGSNRSPSHPTARSWGRSAELRPSSARPSLERGRQKTDRWPFRSRTTRCTVLRSTTTARCSPSAARTTGPESCACKTAKKSCASTPTPTMSWERRSR